MFRSFLAGITVGSVTALLALQYHLVRTDDGLVVIPRVHQPPVRSAYVDTRSWTLDMWKNYPEVTEAVILSGRSNLIVDRAARRIQEQPDTALLPMENGALRQNREAMESLLNVNLPRTAPRTNEVQIDPPPPRRMPDQKRPAGNSPMAAVEMNAGELRPMAPAAAPTGEERLVPLPLTPVAPAAPPAKAEDAAAGKKWFLQLLKSSLNDDGRQRAATSPAPPPLQPVPVMAERAAEELWPSASNEAGPPAPRMLLQLPQDNRAWR